VSTEASRHCIQLTLAYDGSAFSGIAPQTNARTVGRVLSEAIHKMDPNAGRVRIASRTDAGVHARGQIVTFETSTKIGLRGWLLGLSGHLPPQIAVRQVARVPAPYDPSKRALRKTYRYLILQGTVRDPFYVERAWRVSERLNHQAMREEAEALLGEHDFRAFRGAADFRTETVRHISKVLLATDPLEPRLLCFEIEGNRFMFRMVRIIVGALVDVGRGRIESGAIRRALNSGNRDDLGVTAPAEGLYLESIVMPDDALEKWPNHL
jgi:tRNA pseudouridine38-40 synthase